MSFFTSDRSFTGPPITTARIQKAEKALGRKLPASYLSLLEERNGGVPVRRCFRTSRRTSWANDHIEIEAIRGLSGEWGIDSKSGLGSQDLIEEWGYPDIGIVICHLPSGGHDTIMLDYRVRNAEPSVVYIDEDRSILKLADTFEEFTRGLYTCGADQV